MTPTLFDLFSDKNDLIKQDVSCISYLHWRRKNQCILLVVSGVVSIHYFQNIGLTKTKVFLNLDIKGGITELFRPSFSKI